MANYTYNDKGERIIAVGAPNSIVRLRHERPLLIAELQKLSKDEAREVLSQMRYHFDEQITKQWRENILECAFPSFLTQVNFQLEDIARRV